MSKPEIASIQYWFTGRDPDVCDCVEFKRLDNGWEISVLTLDHPDPYVHLSSSVRPSQEVARYWYKIGKSTLLREAKFKR